MGGMSPLPPPRKKEVPHDQTPVPKPPAYKIELWFDEKAVLYYIKSTKDMTTAILNNHLAVGAMLVAKRLVEETTEKEAIKQ